MLLYHMCSDRNSECDTLNVTSYIMYCLLCESNIPLNVLFMQPTTTITEAGL
jgi:hypothetical protein